MKQPDHIDLTETAPGEWGFVRLLRLTTRRRQSGDAEARREAFFNSLAGESRPRRGHRWWEGWIGIWRLSVIYFGAIIAIVVISNIIAAIRSVFH
jgi:hypothetical protein